MMAPSDGVILRAPLAAGDVGAAQRHAADPAWSVWVSASAGSGKTKVLADRVTRLLLDGVDPQKILCLTFTKAAAAEMAIRLTQRLSHWATCADSALDRELDSLLAAPPETAQRDRARRLFAQVLACPGGMRIQTIHSFAQEVLCRFPLEAGLAPQFALMEEAESNALWREVFHAQLEQAAEGKDEQAARALSLLVQRMGEDRLIDVLQEVRNHASRLRRTVRDAGGIDAFLGQVYTALGTHPAETEGQIQDRASAEGSFDRPALLHAARLIAEKASPKFSPRGRTILEWLQKDAQARAEGFDAYSRAFLTDKGTLYADIANKPLLQEHPEIADIIGAEAQRVLRACQEIEALAHARETEAVLTLGLRMIEAYAARKASKAALDFDDLIARTNDLFARPDIAAWVLFKLDGGIDHILVDESQDTNPAQWHIVRTLAEEFFAGRGARDDRGRTLFVVGDEKQSIYSFLKADPEEFARMRAYFSERIRAAEKPYTEVPLNVSFRSAPAILRAVDAVFETLAVRAGVSHEPVRHLPFRAEGAGRVELWPLCEKVKDEAKNKRGTKQAEDWTLPLGYETAQDPAAELAGLIAVQIRQWIDSGQTVYDRSLKADRPMTPGDVMVLVQRRGPFVEHLVSALKHAQIAVSGVDRMVLAEQLAVKDLLALLQFALLPEDDLTLACVLRGPFIGASEEDLMRLAVGRSGSLWRSLKAAAQADARTGSWGDYLEGLAGLADRLTPLALLTHILVSPCPADAFSGRRAIAARLGPDAEDPVDELLNVAENFSAHQSQALQTFLQALLASDLEIKRELEQAMGRVRITTVHASKGLEAPVVILPDTVYAPARAKLPKIMWDEISGVAFYVSREPSVPLLARLRGGLRQKQMEEYRRLLYVALTRAADRLYICGYKGEKADAFEESWYSLVCAALKPRSEEAFEADPSSLLQPLAVLADYALPAQNPAAEPEQTKKRTSPARPGWLFAPPPAEPSPPRPLVPSRPSEEEPPSLSPQDPRFARGRIIHRLLQSLPDLAPDRREAATQRFLANPQHGLASAQQEEIAAEVLRLLADPAFAPLFGPDSRAEIPVVGLSEGRLISGQIDRLALVGDEVWIVDYKTNRPPPVTAEAVPAVYQKQMEAYRTVLGAVYPGRVVRCFLLWTYAPRLMEILPQA